MPMQFTVRFAAILFFVSIISAVLVHFFLDPKFAIEFWIFFVPFILGIPILSAVVLTTDEEIELGSIQ